MRNGYTHGPITCRDCFLDNEDVKKIGDWRLYNNPGYFGSRSPKIIVLGFSKGANQNEVANSGEFDEIAFAKARHRLQEVLETLGLMPADRHIDSLLTAREREFGVASLVRCSFCKIKDGKCKTSGDVIPSSFTNKATFEIIEYCATKYLGRLPSGTRLVVLLGTSDTYIKKTMALFERLFSDFKVINDVSFAAGDALWVYATHPSPGNGYFNAWAKNGSTDPSGRKRILVQEALSKYYEKGS